MKPICDALIFLERRLNVWLVASFVLLSNVWWTVVLQALNRQFIALSGYALPDLQNGTFAPRITLEGFLNQLSSYNNAARGFYWTFFVLDNIVPVVAFAPFALLWIYFLRSSPNRLYRALLASPFILIPLGIGLFDWWENLFYAAAIQNGSAPQTGTLIQAGFAFGFIKGLCVQATFFLTGPMLIYHLFTRLQRALKRPLPSKASSNA